jgi:hypothetical protein
MRHCARLIIIIIIILKAGSHCVGQAGLDLSILLPQPLSAGITGLHHHLLLLCEFLIAGFN